MVGAERQKEQIFDFRTQFFPNGVDSLIIIYSFLKSGFQLRIHLLRNAELS